MKVKSEIVKIPVATTRDEPQIILTLTGEKEIMTLWNLVNYSPPKHPISVYGNLTEYELNDIRHKIYERIDDVISNISVDKLRHNL